MTYPGDAVNAWAAGLEAADISAATNAAALAARADGIDSRITGVETNVVTVYDTAVTAIEEGPRRPEFYDGFDPNGDAAPFIRQAVLDVMTAANGYPAYVELGAREYLIGSEIIVDGKTPLIGQGGYAGRTRLRHFGDYRGPLIGLQGGRDGEAAIDSTTWHPNISEEGVRVEGIQLLGDRGMSGHPVGMVCHGTVDSPLLNDISARYLTGGGIFLGDSNPTVNGAGATREGVFANLEIRGCGDLANGYLAGTAQNAAIHTGDGSNQLSFPDMKVVYNYAPFVIQNHHASEKLRRVSFSGNFMLHGLAHAGVSDSPGDLMQIVGDVTAVYIGCLFTNGSSTGNACIRTKASPISGKSPQTLAIGWGSFSTNYGDGVVLERIQNFRMDAEFVGTTPGKNVRVPAGSGLVKGELSQFGSNNNSIDPALLTGSPPKFVVR